MQINGLAALYQTSLKRQGTNVGQSESGQQTQNDNSGGTIGSYDFTSMSRNEMKSVAKKMYESGAIDMDQLTSITLAGPLGKAGPNGEFIPFTPLEREQIDSQPMNYHQLVADAISGIESQGRVSDPTSGYENWLSLQSALKEWQNRPFSAKIDV